MKRSVLNQEVVSTIRDLWNRKDLPAVIDTFKTEVEPHGVVIVKINGQKAPASTLKFEQTSIEIIKGNHKLIHVNVIPSTTPLVVNSSDEDILSLSIAGVNTYKLSAWKEGNCLIKASTTDGKLNASCNVHIARSNIPAPWKLNDIKDDKASADYENGVLSIEGGGADIWGTNDQFAFLNRNANQDTFISARIVSQTNTDPWAKTGLMFRESREPNSVFVMLCVTPGNGVSLQWRNNTGGISDKKDFIAVALPVYLKFLKKGITFSAYKSDDGNQWQPLGDVTLSHAFAEKYLIGMEVLSHSSHMLNLSKFDQVKVESAAVKKHLR